MKMLRTLKSNIIVLVILGLLLMYFGSVYSAQSRVLERLQVERIDREREVEEARSEFERYTLLYKSMNTEKAKEDKIRERLNMIKKDEIQFIFSE